MGSRKLVVEELQRVLATGLAPQAWLQGDIVDVRAAMGGDEEAELRYWVTLDDGTAAVSCLLHNHRLLLFHDLHSCEGSFRDSRVQPCIVRAGAVQKIFCSPSLLLSGHQASRREEKSMRRSRRE